MSAFIESRFDRAHGAAQLFTAGYELGCQLNNLASLRAGIAAQTGIGFCLFQPKPLHQNADDRADRMVAYDGCMHALCSLVQ